MIDLNEKEEIITLADNTGELHSFIVRKKFFIKERQYVITEEIKQEEGTEIEVILFETKKTEKGRTFRQVFEKKEFDKISWNLTKEKVERPFLVIFSVVVFLLIFLLSFSFKNGKSKEIGED